MDDAARRSLLALAGLRDDLRGVLVVHGQSARPVARLRQDLRAYCSARPQGEERSMSIAKLCLAASIIAASTISVGAVELINPHQVLEHSRRANIEFDQRMKREAAERERREKEQKAQQEKEKRAQEAQRKKDIQGEQGKKAQGKPVAKAAQGGRAPAGKTVPPQPTESQPAP